MVTDENCGSKTAKFVVFLDCSLKVTHFMTGFGFFYQVRHSQDIAALQSSLNSSREDIGKLSLVWISVNSTQKELQQQKQLLGLAENSIEKEIHKVWTAVNASNTGIQQQLMKVKYNLTTQVSWCYEP